jgi:hypothetical protein
VNYIVNCMYDTKTRILYPQAILRPIVLLKNERESSFLISVASLMGQDENVCEHDDDLALKWNMLIEVLAVVRSLRFIRF